jgi:hypothetical protein
VDIRVYILYIYTRRGKMGRYFNTFRALATYDVAAKERKKLRDNITDETSFKAWELKEKADLRAVQTAFFLDTREVNSLLRCLATTQESIRREVGYPW